MPGLRAAYRASFRLALGDGWMS